MSSLSYSSAYSAHHLLQILLLIALIAIAWCNAIGDAQQRIDFDTEPFQGKGDVAKRPFGGGSFSGGRSYGGRWVGAGQASLTPWPMSKYVNRHDAKRHNRERSAQPREETSDDWSSRRYPVDKRPFGPGVFSRPSAHRTVKRPFGGGVIYSRPRGEAGSSKSSYRRYGYSRERRVEGQLQNSPNYRPIRSPDLSSFRDGGDVRQEDVSRAWMKIADALRRRMNDYGDDEYDLGFVEDQDDEDDDDDEKSGSPPEARKLEISDKLFEEKRKTA